MKFSQIEFYLQNKYGYNIIANDKFKPLFSFWKACKDHKEALCTDLRQNMQITKEICAKRVRDTYTHLHCSKYIYIYICSSSE